MALHPDTFEYLKPTDRQIQTMSILRHAAARYARDVDQFVPNSADKTYALRKIREIAMWVNVAITRCEDGARRGDPTEPGPGPR